MAEMMVEKHRPVAALAEVSPQISREKGQFRPFLPEPLGAAPAFHPEEGRRAQHGTKGQPRAAAEHPVLPWHRNRVHAVQTDSGLAQAPGHRLNRQRRHVLDTGEALLLGRREDAAVPDQRRRRVAHVRQPQNQHAGRINEADGAGKFIAEVAIRQ